MLDIVYLCSEVALYSCSLVGPRLEESVNCRVKRSAYHIPCVVSALIALFDIEQLSVLRYVYRGDVVGQREFVAQMSERGDIRLRVFLVYRYLLDLGAVGVYSYVHLYLSSEYSALGYVRAYFVLEEGVLTGKLK